MSFATVVLTAESMGWGEDEGNWLAVSGSRPVSGREMERHLRQGGCTRRFSHRTYVAVGD